MREPNAISGPGTSALTNRILAALDVGTNSTLFLLAEVSVDGNIRPLQHEVRTNDLGRGLDAEGQLSPQTIDLNLQLLLEFKRTAEQAKAQAIRIAGTEALRQAGNAAILIKRAKQELGLDIRVLTGEEEAALTFHGVISGLDHPEQPILLIDVGGGSTEFILGAGGRLGKSASLPLGAVTLDRQFTPHDPMLADEIASMRGHINSVLETLPPAFGVQSAPLVICGGTASALAGVDLELSSYQPEKLSGHGMTQSRLERFIHQFRTLSLEQRRALPGIGYRRAEIILPGALIIDEILRHFQRDHYVTSERGLRYGLLLAEVPES